MKNHFIIVNDKTVIEEDGKDKLISTVYQFLYVLEYEYPEFRRWYFDKVVRGLYNGSRTMILDVNNDVLRGVAILKTSLENKICTLRVHPGYRRGGIGSALLGLSLEILQYRYPLITVSGCRINQFVPLLKNFDFQLTEVHRGYYNPGSDEFVFNGNLREPSPQKYIPLLNADHAFH